MMQAGITLGVYYTSRYSLSVKLGGWLSTQTVAPNPLSLQSVRGVAHEATHSAEWQLLSFISLNQRSSGMHGLGREPSSYILKCYIT